MHIQPHSKKNSFYREEALAHYLRESEGMGILKVSPPWTWVVVWIFGLLVFAGLVLGIFGRVEITERGKGILRPTSGVRVLQAQRGGVIAEIFAHSGSTVLASQPILRINSAQVKGAALEAYTGLTARKHGFQSVIQSQNHLFAQQLDTLQQRLPQLQEHVKRCMGTLARANGILGKMSELKALGIFSVKDYNREEENRSSAERQLADAKHALRQAEQELANLQTQRLTQIWRDQTDLEAAKARMDAVGLAEDETIVTAPVAGLVDGLVLRVGDPIQSGQLLAKLVPKESPLVAIAFLKEKDRGFVKEGDEVQLELSQYPFSEFGTLKGQIRTVAADLASPVEWQEAFGHAATSDDNGPSFRVEIDLTENAHAAQRAKVQLRTGMHLSARFTLRRQSPITFAVEPLRRWLNR
jgi:multidrug resistance efflux pump